MLESWESETILDDEGSGKNRKEGEASYVFRHVSNLRLVPHKEDVLQDN